MLTYRKMFLDDIPKVMKLQLRKEDQIECEAASGLSWVAALSFAVLNSEDVKLIVLDGRIVGLFGLAAVPGDPYCAAPWMLAGDGLFTTLSLRALFSRRSTDVVKKMLEKYPLLENYVAVSNTKAIRWLTWLGFSFDPKPVTLVDPAVKFVRFWKGVRPCAG